MSVPHNNVMDLNNVMQVLKVSHHHIIAALSAKYI